MGGGNAQEPPPRPKLVSKDIAELFAGGCRWSENRQLVESWDLKKQASQLSKDLPRDYKLLTALVADPDIPVDRRAKVLEVMIFRGATNARSYMEMQGEGPTNPDTSKYEYLQAQMKYEKQWKEHCLYQEAARDAIFRDPALFDQISKSEDQLPQGRTAATEMMNSMLKNGGMYGAHEGRQEFEKLLMSVPPETRGRMMYHVEDAAQSGDIHQKGERRETGVGGEISVGDFGIGYGTQWDHVADNHWREAGKDVNRQIVHDLKQKGDGAIADFTRGYQDAKGVDKLPGVGDSAEQAR